MTTPSIRRTAGLTTIGLTMGALAVPATGRKAPLQPRHPCPALIVSNHPWQNFKDGKKTEWGDHWLLQWQSLYVHDLRVARVIAAGVGAVAAWRLVGVPKATAARARGVATATRGDPSQRCPEPSP
jgi:hypothetical protein